MSFQSLHPELVGRDKPSVLIIDDEFTSRAILEQVVKNIDSMIGVHIYGNPVTAVEWVSANPVDMILLDYLMEGMSGLEVIQKIRQVPALIDVPIVIITALENKALRYQLLEAGATDYLTKPIDPYECTVRCRNLLSLRLHQKVVKNRARQLEQAVQEATQQILEREQETLLRLAIAGEYRDYDTGNHVVRMAHYAYLIAEGLGLDAEHCELIKVAAPLHDIGKIGIADHILQKPGRHTPEETEVMRNHAAIGHQILCDSPSKFIALAAEISLGHHEKFDGTGYPNRLVGENIPLESRIVAVADVYDALTSARPYKRAWPMEEAVEYIVTHSGTHFDPKCVNAFIKQLAKVVLSTPKLQNVTVKEGMGRKP